MLKIFLTGDNHIGLKYANHEKAAVLVESRISAFEKMVNKANDEECDLFVISGDLFENTYSITKRDIDTLLAIVSKFKGVVAVLPGNHDYYNVKNKLWMTFEKAMSTYDNIMLLNEFKPYTLTCNDDKVTLYPALCTTIRSEEGKNNLDWIKNTEIQNDGFNIGIAHGAVVGETIDNEGAYFLMSREELNDIPVDVWLLGHTHVPFPKNLKEDFKSVRDKIFNAGTHTQTNVNNCSEGNCFIIEIDDNKKIRAKKFVSGNLHFYRKDIEVNVEGLKYTLDRELSDYGDNSVVEINLKGAIEDDEYENRNTIINDSLQRFLESKCNDSELSTIISEDFIKAKFPETSFSAKILMGLLGNMKEAQLAYELLESVKEENK